jgi:predicted flap endonuclease-1-like 5' DNA nuclease
MNSSEWARGPLAAAEKMFPLTVLNLTLIAIGAIGALFIILWGIRLARQRRAVRERLAERGELASPAHHAAEPEPVAEPEPLAAPAPALAFDAPAGPPDDLTRMKGVGPRLAQQLGDAGITRFAQIAALSPDEAEALDARLGTFQGRLARDRWIEQATLLAAGDTEGFEKAFGKL